MNRALLSLFIAALGLSVSACNCPLENCALTKDGKCYEPPSDREKRPMRESTLKEAPPRDTSR